MLRAPDCNGWPRDGLRDNGAIGTQEEPAVFRRNTKALSVLRDGNGRVSRPLFLLECYHCGIEAGRHFSLERIIEDSKEGYYEARGQSSVHWHDGKHDP